MYTEIISHQFLPFERCFCSHGKNWFMRSQCFKPGIPASGNAPFAFEFEDVKQGDGVAKDVLNVDIAKREGD